MLDLLKKIGVPATVAAVIASIVTVTPFIFKIDERYAKSEELSSASTKTEKMLADLAVEVSRLAGIQQTMLTLMSQTDRRVADAALQPTTIYVPTPRRVVGGAPAPVAAPDDCDKLTSEGFKCMGAAKPAPAPAPVTTVTEQIPIKITPPAKTQEQLAEEAARRKQFEQVGEALRRSQTQLQSIQGR